MVFFWGMLRSIMAARCVSILTQVILMLLLCPGALDACSADLYVTTPGRLEVLNGSCVQIPCNFTPASSSESDVAFDVNKSVFGVWIKKDHNFGLHRENVIFNSSVSNNAYPMNITGDLRTMDCTTLFSNLITAYSDLYYFRIENKPYLATAVCDPLRITVKDSPWSPSLKVSGNQTETEVVTITCSAVTPCPHAPPQLTWNLHQGTPHITEKNPDRTLTTVIKLRITLTDSDDGKIIKCSAAYPVSGGVSKNESNITLSVTYGPKNTSVRVSPSGALSLGQSVTLSCSSRANPPVQNFTWFRRNPEGPDFNVSEGDTYNFNLTEDGDFYCVASNGVRKELSPVINLKIEYPAADLPWKVIFGAGIGLLIVLCLAVLVWYFRSKRQASGQTQREPLEEDESIHYGEIDFSKFSPKVAPDAVQEETVYAQVQVPKPENAPPTEDLSELYAQVQVPKPENAPPTEDLSELYAQVNKK